jgi:CheY-like chemotaxis protein
MTNQRSLDQVNRKQSGDHSTEPEIKVYEIPDEESEVGQRTILLLDDESQVATVLKDFLESRSFHVTTAKDGVEGLKKIMASDFDVILCDLMMPNLPGDMFYLAVERTKPQLCKKFIFMTGYQSDPKWQAFIKKVKGVVLAKPFEFRLLLETITRVLITS